MIEETSWFQGWAAEVAGLKAEAVSLSPKATPSASSGSLAAFESSDDRGPEADQEDHREEGEDRNPAVAKELMEDEALTDSEGHR